MRYRLVLTPIAAAALAAMPARAQQTAQTAQTVQATSQAAAVTIDSAMTKAQVIERFGKPAKESTRGTFTYLFYGNGSEQRVGMSDLVILDGDRVIDAILRSPNRAYSGRSSSPRAIPPEEAARNNPSRSGMTVPGRG